MASAAKRAPVKSPREEAEEPASAQPAPAGRARRRLLLIGGGLLAVAALASGVTWMLLPKPAAHPATKAAAGAEQAAAADAAAPEAADAQPALYLELTPAFVVNLSDEESMRFLQVNVEVMARDPKVIDAVKEHMPRIRNALMLLFSQQSSHSIAGREAKESLQKQALDEVQKALQAEGAAAEVSAIYFTGLVMQ